MFVVISIYPSSILKFLNKTRPHPLSYFLPFSFSKANRVLLGGVPARRLERRPQEGVQAVEAGEGCRDSHSQHVHFRVALPSPSRSDNLQASRDEGGRYHRVRRRLLRGSLRRHERPRLQPGCQSLLYKLERSGEGEALVQPRNPAAQVRKARVQVNREREQRGGEGRATGGEEGGEGGEERNGARRFLQSFMFMPLCFFSFVSFFFFFSFSFIIFLLLFLFFFLPLPLPPLLSL